MRISIRVDAGAQIGLGHAMRCATLAAGLGRHEHEVVVFSHGLPASVVSRFREAGSDVRLSWRRTSADEMEDVRTDVAVVDGYGLGDEVRELAERDVRVCVVDDNHELPVEVADLILNQNPHAADIDYPDVPGQRRLLGLDYALIRSDVRTVVRRVVREPSLVLVAIGGTDPTRSTLQVVDELLAGTSARLAASFGGDHPDAAGLQRRVDRSGRVVRASPDLRSEFAAAAVAVVGGGSTLWELAHLGVPAVALCVAENQRAGTAAAARLGTAWAIGAEDGLAQGAVADAVGGLLADPGRRRRMSARGRALVDGHGVDRVVSELVQLVNGG